MEPWLRGRFGNPTAVHRSGREARRAVDDARDVIAAALGAEPGEVVYTSGGTEADNLAILGVDAAVGGRPWCSAIEHHAVLAPVASAGGHTIPVTGDGRVDLAALNAMLDAVDAGEISELPSVVSVMAVNNETGVIQPISEVAAAVRERTPDVRLHVDAVQALLWLEVAAVVAPADLVSVSAHKVGGPQGVGALIVRDGTPMRAQMLGGGQERERRSGTHNVAGIVGFAAAVADAVEQRRVVAERVGRLRDRLTDGLLMAVPDAFETGVAGTTSTASVPGAPDRSHKGPATCHLCFEDIEAEALLFLLDREAIAASAASSCASGALEPSHVLAAMGVPRELAAGSLRLSLGPDTTDADVGRALAVIPAAVARLRETGR